MPVEIDVGKQTLNTDFSLAGDSACTIGIGFAIINACPCGIFQFRTDREIVLGIEVIADSQTTAEATFIAVYIGTGNTGNASIKSLNPPTNFRRDINAIFR